MAQQTRLSQEGTRKLLVLDSSFSFEAIRTRHLEQSVTCRDLGGYFAHVWTTHPFATLVTSDRWTSRFGRPDWHGVNKAHTFIEGKVGRYAMLKRLSALNFLLAQVDIFRALSALIRKEGISVIRAGSPLYLGLLAWALSRWCGIPFVVRVGGNHDRIFKDTGQQQEKRLFRHRSVEKIVERFVFRRADLVAGANQDNLNFALANGARPERSTVFRYGNLIDPRHFVDPSRRDSGDELLNEMNVVARGFLLYIGRLQKVKRPEDVLRVLADLRGRGVHLKAVLVGEGPLEQDLKELANELDLAECVVLCGNRDQGWLARVIPTAALVVSPHTGRALTEAALGAAPVVAYDVDWQGELIETGETGELVPFADWKAMAASAYRLATDTVYARSAGSRLRQRVLEMMDPVRLDEHERQEYDKVLRRTAARTHDGNAHADRLA